MVQRNRQAQAARADAEGSEPSASAPERVSTVADRESARLLDERDQENGRESGDRDDIDGEDLSDEEFLRAFREYSDQSVLPNLPTLPGYHVCWLTTNNPRDTVANRMRMGYRLIRQSDMPGWDGASIKTGDYAGFVGINEMVAAKLPLKLYNLFMREAHSTRPKQEEAGLRARVQKIKEELEAYSLVVDEGSGMKTLGRTRREMVEDLRE